jgi:hypothetical protein
MVKVKSSVQKKKIKDCITFTIVKSDRYSVQYLFHCYLATIQKKNEKSIDNLLRNITEFPLKNHFITQKINMNKINIISTK